MKDYHRILELPADATDDQIRAHYKRLVRVYHPDRFTSPQDKIYVEDKLREINEAYNKLLSRSTKPLLPRTDTDNLTATTTIKTAELLPQPVAFPAALDFGELSNNERKTLIFQLKNTGGIVQKFQLEYSADSEWFKVANGHRLHKQRPFPMEFAVVVDASRLQRNQNYSGWIQINMDKAKTCIPVTVKASTPILFCFFSSRIAISLSMLTMIVMLFTVQFLYLLNK